MSNKEWTVLQWLRARELRQDKNQLEDVLSLERLKRKITVDASKYSPFTFYRGVTAFNFPVIRNVLVDSLVGLTVVQARSSIYKHQPQISFQHYTSSKQFE
jgi:hypothetical protein